MNALVSATLQRRLSGAALPTPLNIVIAYDGIAAAQHALDILGTLNARGAGAVTQMCASTWWFKFLEDPDQRARATAAAAKADLLVIAANHLAGLPGGVETWLESSLAKKRRSEVAVVALLGEEEQKGEADSPCFQFVRRIAREAGAYFFAPFSKRAYSGRLVD